MPVSFAVARDLPDDAEVFAVPVFQGGELPAGTPVELADDFLAARRFEGKPGQALPLMADDGSTILALGVGPREKVDADVVRRAAATMARQSGAAARVATTLLDAVGPDGDRNLAAQALAEGASLATYRFRRYKSTSNGGDHPLEQVTVVGRGGAAVQRALERGARLAAAAAFARDLGNTPAHDLTPTALAELATQVAEEQGLSVRIWDEDDIDREGLGGLAGVAAGSEEPARLIRLEYDPGNARSTIALVGKGITFDSGGLNIKTYEGMLTMKTDMSGAATVLAAMSVLPALAPRVRVIAYAACTENMPGRRAMKPGDVLRARNGKTIEVHNTDAEGRLVLSDALSLAVEDGPDAIVDVATLTGAVSVALGREIAGLMGTSDDLLEQVEAAAERAGEPVWRLPLPDRYRKHIDSEVADIKNVGAAGQAGTIAAGMFLKEFVGDVPWAHLDIAGTARTDSDDGYVSKGSTGFAVRTLVELVTSFRKPRR